MSVTQFPAPRREQATEIAPLGKVLLERGHVEPGDLAQATDATHRSGAELGGYLLAHGMARDDHVARARAELLSLAYADLAQQPPDPALSAPESLDIYLTYHILPWRKVGSIMAYATAAPELAQRALDRLQPKHGMALMAVTSRKALDQAVMDLYGPELAERAALRTPGPVSVRTLGARRLMLFIPMVALLIAFVQAPEIALAVLGYLLLVLSTATAATRLAVLLFSRRERPRSLPSGTVALAARRPLPRVSVLVPLYREAAMIPKIAAALSKVTYPAELLEVKLLLEANDTDTIAAAQAADLPPWMAPVIVPDGVPRTKPRALNLALDFCDGEIIGILDAEDHPDPDQFRIVAEHLRAAPPDVACVQCQLAFFNARENWITRCFQIEYAIWFDVLLRGWQRLGLPVPLGGTSVYFRTQALRQLGGWDAHNVTEDADLGMRLARHDLRTEIVSSTTEEEANGRVLPWIRQRSRWLKGYMLTWLCHMRDPVGLWRDLGPVAFFGFQILFLGGAASYLAMPLFWIALVLTLVSGTVVYGPAMPDGAMVALGVSLALGQGIMLVSAMLALWRRGRVGLMVWVPSLLVYWTLGAAAAYKAVIELIAAPYFWDKTEHGVSRVAAPTEAAVGEDLTLK